MPARKHSPPVSKPAATPSVWRNRIVGTAEVPPDQLLAFPYNARLHPPGQQAALEAALEEVGWVQDIVVSETSGRVLDGHLRVSLALRHGVPLVPVKYVRLAEHEEALVVATLDPIAAMAGYDTEVLAALLGEVATGQAALQQLLSDLAEREGVLPSAQRESDPAPAQQPADEVECPACGHRFVA